MQYGKLGETQTKQFKIAKVYYFHLQRPACKHVLRYHMSKSSMAPTRVQTKQFQMI